MEKAMAPHSNTLAWKISWTEEPGRLQSVGSRRVRHDWATSLSLFSSMHGRRKWQPTPILLAWRIPGMAEPGGLRSMGSHRVRHNWSNLAAAAASSKGNLWVLKVLLMNLNIFDELQFVTVIISDAHIVSYLSVETLFSWLLTLLT